MTIAPMRQVSLRYGRKERWKGRDRRMVGRMRGMEGRKGRKEGRKEERKDGRKEGRKEGRKKVCGRNFKMKHVTVALFSCFGFFLKFLHSLLQLVGWSVTLCYLIFILHRFPIKMNFHRQMHGI